MDNAPQGRDVINCYVLWLGREPESAKVIEERLALTKSELLPSFFASGEFLHNVRFRIENGRSLRGGAFDAAPTEDLISWAAEFAPLSAAGAEGVRTASNWYGLYHALFADEVFAELVLTGEARASNPGFLAALSSRDRIERDNQIAGGLELIAATEIRGWAVDESRPDRRLALELFVDDRFEAAGVTELYRSDLRERFGGDGQAGFVIRLPADRVRRTPVAAEIREAASGVIIGAFMLPELIPPPADTAASIRRDLAELRTLLTRVESMLPELNDEFSFALEDYDRYFEAYHLQDEDQARQDGGPVDVSVVLDASAVPVAALDAALRSLCLQRRRPSEVSVIYPEGDLQIEYEACIAGWTRAVSGAVLLRGVLMVAEGWVDAMDRAVQAGTARHLLFVSARSRVAPGAIGAITQALAGGAALVYADGDEIELRPDGRDGPHVNPSLRSGFDYDLLLQHNFLGDLIGLSSDVASALGLRHAYKNDAIYDLILRAFEDHGAGRIVHLPYLLSHTVRSLVEPSRDPSEERLAALRDHLSRIEPTALAQPHDDVLGAHGPAALRVKYPAPATTKVAVIIPTRDRLDLLAPCLTSLAATASSNAVQMEIIVVDNQSAEPATAAFLKDFSRQASLRVVEHDGAFNWALMNNRAAAQTDADVLIFLNNDTVMLTPDWCDELCSQALRPTVGAVGARLLYEDGTIQHAGVVMGGWHSFAAHDGVGARGSDPGYLGRHTLLRQVCAVTGACLATRASVFHALGGFDAVAFPVEANDVDYCLRLRAQGLHVLYDPYCTMYHFESKSRGYNTDPEKQRRAEAADKILRGRWAEAYRQDVYYNPHFDRLSAPFRRLRPYAQPRG